MTETLEDRIRRLEDIEAIRQLKARYCQACDDDHNPDKVAACFVPDGLWEGKNIGVYAKSHDAIKAYIGGVRASGRMRNSAHMVTNPIIQVTGDRATGEWRFIMLFTGKINDGSLQYHRIIGFYEEEYVRVDGRWLFEGLHVTVEESGPYSTEDSKFV
ncbi:nuclear transport factor 2 family protein [Iodidimonas sp. SYSU 1G8]|uniref:nuclear transport factor 2 family protein n=1 Tax=Iodidimonas sp. SYSU 1G8 TaxID=3133967 RepID=UPI0031FEA24A